MRPRVDEVCAARARAGKNRHNGPVRHPGRGHLAIRRLRQAAAHSCAGVSRRPEGRGSCEEVRQGGTEGVPAVGASVAPERESRGAGGRRKQGAFHARTRASESRWQICVVFPIGFYTILFAYRLLLHINLFLSCFSYVLDSQLFKIRNNVLYSNYFL